MIHLNQVLSALLLLCTIMACQAPADSEAATPPPAYTAADVTKVEQLIQDCFDDIWSELDTAKLDDYHTADFLLQEHGELWTNDTIANYQIRAAAQRAENPYERHNYFDFFRTEIYGDAIWLAYHNYAVFLRDGDTLGRGQWLESAIAIETPEGWRLQSLHSTRVPQE